MRISGEALNSVISKIANITSGDKHIPGVMFDLTNEYLDVCYSDGHKSYVERVDVTIEDGDKVGQIIIDFEQLQRAVKECQSYDRYKVSEVEVEYGEKVITLKAQQVYITSDAEGNEKAIKVADKKFNLAWKEPGEDIRASILTRMNYDTIFDDEISADEFDKAELIEALNKATAEKSRVIYFSNKTHSIFVQNQAHLTAIPISKLRELTIDDQDSIRAELVSTGEYSDERFAEVIKEEENRIHYSLALSTQSAKAITYVFNNCKSKEIYISVKDKFVNVYVDTDDEHIGLWLEMAGANKVHVGAFERYNAIPFNTYHINTYKAVLLNCIESALNSTTSEKTAIKFTGPNEENHYELEINASSSAKSIADDYKVVVFNVIDNSTDKSLTSKSFNVSLQILDDMIKQLNTESVAVDFDINEQGITCIRISEIDSEKATEEYKKAREKTQELCAQQAIQFDPTSTPTPIELKMEYRVRTLNTRQYTILAK